MASRIDLLRPGISRRNLVLGGLATAALAGCGGGGGGTTLPVPGPGPGGRSGYLVYRNSGTAAVYNFGTNTELQFDPGVEPSFDPGMAVSRTGLITSALDGDNSTFGIAVFGLNGVRSETYTVPRPFAFQTSAAVYNADASRIAFSVNEPRSSTDNTRVDRTLVIALATGNVIATLDGYVEPMWAGTNGELVARSEASDALRLFGASYNDLGPLGGLVISSRVGGYDISADGRYVVYSDGPQMRAYDRSTGASWVAADDPTSSPDSPALSPDGQYLAFIAIDLVINVPHVVPFSTGTTVTVNSSVHALQNTLADCQGRMGWTA